MRQICGYCRKAEKDCLLDLPEIQVIEPVVVVEEEPLPQKGAICEPCMSMVSYLTPTEEPLKSTFGTRIPYT